MRLRLADTLILAALLTTGGWSEDGCAQAKLPRVGVLGMVAENSQRQFYEEFYRTFQNQGFIDGRNVAFAYASAPNDPSRFAEAAAELVRLEVDVIFADNAPVWPERRLGGRTLRGAHGKGPRRRQAG
jgi:ABC-type uncharacterized transport system substrate-binding protein